MIGDYIKVYARNSEKLALLSTELVRYNSETLMRKGCFKSKYFQTKQKKLFITKHKHCETQLRKKYLKTELYRKEIFNQTSNESTEKEIFQNKPKIKALYPKQPNAET